MDKKICDKKKIVIGIVSLIAAIVVFFLGFGLGRITAPDDENINAGNNDGKNNAWLNTVDNDKNDNESSEDSIVIQSTFPEDEPTQEQTTNKPSTNDTEDTETNEITTGDKIIEADINEEATPVALHGQLSVQGTDLVDEHGEKFQLYGMSTHGITWFPEYVNYDAFKTLRDDWNTNVVRLALYTHEYNGYCSGGNQEELKNIVCNGVEYATQLGMYVIIDWHVLNEQDPSVYQSQAVDFFREMSEKYAGYNNVIYEICNEPNGWSTWDSVKNYANTVIPVIRANDSDAVIIVGTPTWSQDIDKAAESPIIYDNIMYALHFYAATHTEWLRERVKQCISAGLPVFISEFGICDSSGNGAIDYYQAQEWMNLIKEYNLSYCAWNLANKDETSSVIASWCTKTSDWDDSELSESGKWLKNQFINEN